jgi:general secretion pathway protein I
MRMRGFTLIEVLVALAIVAVALLSSLRAVGVMAQSSAELDMRLLAQLSARNQIALLRASGAFPPLGQTSTACPQGELDLICRQEIKATPNEFFRRVEVRVYQPSEPDRHLAELIGILPRAR